MIIYICIYIYSHHLFLFKSIIIPMISIMLCACVRDGSALMPFRQEDGDELDHTILRQSLENSLESVENSTGKHLLSWKRDKEFIGKSAM